jgi:hypothetical protein
MATTASPTLQSQGVSTLDVLWAFYQSQTKKVKKAFLKRIADEDSAVKEAETMRAYEQTLTDEQRGAAYEFVEAVKTRVAEVEKASREGRKIGRSAKDFLRELQAENK